MPRLRQALAGLLALLAVGLTLWPTSAMAVVTARDLAPGVVLTEADLRLVPMDARPQGVLSSLDAVVGQVLTGPARSGEPLTDFRLTRADPDLVSVAVRLADAGVAELLTPGSRIDVIGSDAEVLAEAAAVVAVRPDQLVVIGLGRRNATQVAAASLERPVAVTLR
jgi:Flp pilus assembly protein CpaB